MEKKNPCVSACPLGQAGVFLGAFAVKIPAKPV